jgi:hypothetical protein
MFEEIKKQIENVLYPEPRPYGRSERERLLKKALETPLDLIEGIGLRSFLSWSRPASARKVARGIPR